MRSLKSGLVAVVLAGVFGCAAVAGCSADGGGSGIPEENADPTDPNPPSALPPLGSSSGAGGTSGSSGAPMDAGTTKKDGGKTDAGYDAGPPPPVVGDACTTLNSKASKSCGMCGKAETICLDDGSGKGKWSDYGQCENEQGVCTPGQTQPCGNCGTQTCTNYCAWGACTGMPANACTPGAVENTTAGCATPGTYRNRSCGATCTWSSYSATCAEPINGNKMTASASVNGVASANWTLVPNTGKKVSGTCPNGSVSTNADYATTAVEVANPTGQTLTAMIYHSGTPVLDTQMWIYKKTLAPMDDTAYKACDFGSADSCPTGDPCGNGASGSYNWAGVDNVVIPPNGKVLVYSSGYSSGVSGAFTLNVKTKSLQ